MKQEQCLNSQLDRWVRVSVVIELSGYTDDAARVKIKMGSGK